ncbi:hypothetical protein NFI96_026506, partial [Prochilodus magdalenae]
GNSSLLVLLDLRASHTIDHSILLDRVENWRRNRRSSFMVQILLSDRYQSVNINAQSSTHTENRPVPTGRRRASSTFITSGLGYCNALLPGCSSESLKLQLVQNAAARVLTGARESDHISPV